jgi:hypothetical protein
MSFYKKYLKYKSKYFNLKKNLEGGAQIPSLKRLSLAEMMRWNKQLRIDIGKDPIPKKTRELLIREKKRIKAMEKGAERSKAKKEYKAEFAYFKDPYSVRINPERAMTDDEKVQYDSNEETIEFFGKQDVELILNERDKTNEEFETIKENVWAIREDLIERLIVKYTDSIKRSIAKNADSDDDEDDSDSDDDEDDSEEDEDDKRMIEKGRDAIKAAFDLKESITDLTDFDHLNKKFNEKLEVKLGHIEEGAGHTHPHDTIVVKLLVFPSLFGLKSYAKELGKRRLKSYAKGGSETEKMLKRLKNLKKTGEDPVRPLGPTSIGFETLTAWLASKNITVEDQIKIVEKHIEHDKNVELDTIRRQKGLYIYDEFTTKYSNVRGLNKSRLGVKKKYDDYDSIYYMLRTKDWIFTIVDNGEDSGETKESKTSTALTFNDIARRSGDVLTPFFSTATASIDVSGASRYGAAASSGAAASTASRHEAVEVKRTVENPEDEDDDDDE